LEELHRNYVLVKIIRLTSAKFVCYLVYMSTTSVLQAKRKRERLAEAIKKKRGYVEGQISLREAARAAGVDYNAVYRAQQGKAVNLPNMIALEQWAGVK
jgi:hypothetical protein